MSYYLQLTTDFVISRIVVISQCSFIQMLSQSIVELIIQNQKKRKGI